MRLDVSDRPKFGSSDPWPQMSCSRAQELIAKLRDGQDVSGRDAAHLTWHVTECDQCAQDLQPIGCAEAQELIGKLRRGEGLSPRETAALALHTGFVCPSCAADLALAGDSDST